MKHSRQKWYRGLRGRPLVVCVMNEGFEASLERRKIYRLVPDSQAAVDDLVRIIDESGEDYLYPARMFRPITMSAALRRALLPPVQNPASRRPRPGTRRSSVRSVGAERQ